MSNTSSQDDSFFRVVQKNRPPDESSIDPKIQLCRNSNGYHVELSPVEVNKKDSTIGELNSVNKENPSEELNRGSGMSFNAFNTESTLGELQVARKTTFKQVVPTEIETYTGFYFDILKRRVEELESTLEQEDCSKPDDPPLNLICDQKSYSTSLKKSATTTTSGLSRSKKDMVLLQSFHHKKFDSISLDTITYGSSFYNEGYNHPIESSVDDVVRYQLYDNPLPLLSLPSSESMIDISDVKKYKDQLERSSAEKEPTVLIDIENCIINDYLNYTTSFRRTVPYIYREPVYTSSRKSAPTSSTVYNKLISSPWFFPLKKCIAPVNNFYDKSIIGNDLHNLEKSDPYSSKKSWKPIFTFITTLIMTAYFIAELVNNSRYTGKSIQISPFNVMVGPSPETMIHMGARYTPCMKRTLEYPTTQNVYTCPTINSQSNHATAPLFNDQRSFFHQSPFKVTCPLSGCFLEELCGGIPFKKSTEPNQGYRFISSVFMHSGFIQFVINLGMHFKVGMIVERIINPFRYGIVWLVSGIFGYIFGALFSPQGNVISGCSVCLVGIVGYLLVDTALNWRDIKMPIEIVLKLILCFAISLLVGLLPGYDNFSHIGSLLGGMAISICLVPLSQNTSPMKSQFQAWLIGIMGLLFIAVLLWIFLRLFFAPDTNYCNWCKYFACLPMSDFCQPYFTHFS